MSQHMLLPHPEKGTHHFSMDLASSLQQSLRKEVSGAMKISNQPLQLPGLVLPAQVLSLGTHTQIFVSYNFRLRDARGLNVLVALLTPPWHGDTRHTSPFALRDWGLLPLRGGRSQVQGMLKIHSREFRACPYESPVQEMPPRQSSDPAWPKGQGSAQLHRGQKVITSTLRASKACSKGSSRWGSALTGDQTQHILATAASRSQDTAMEPWAPSQAQAPGALHKTLDKQQHKQDQKPLTHHTIRLLKN